MCVFASERERERLLESRSERKKGVVGGEQIALLKAIMAALFFINSLTHPNKLN